MADTLEKSGRPVLSTTASRLMALYEFLPVPLGLSREGITLDANPACVKLFGYDSVDELRGQSVLRQIAPQCHADVQEKIRRRAAGEPTPTTYETIGVRKDGGQFPMRLSVCRVVADEGPLTVLAIEDLTDLRDALDLEQRLVAASPVGILAYEARGQCVSANEAAGIVLGATPAQLKAQNFRSIPSWKRSGLADQAEEVLRSGCLRTGEVHIVTSFDREVWFSYHLSTFLKSGQPFLLLQFVDVSAAHRREVNLARAQRIAGIGSWSRNQKTGELFWSEEHDRLLGLATDIPPSLERFLGVVAPEDRQKISSTLEEARSGRPPSGIDFRVTRPDGTEIICHAEAELLLDAEGRPAESVGTTQDITEARRQQARIQELLQEEQRARRDAESASRAKDTFLATLSHELRTPLASMLTWVQMILGGRLEAAQARKGLEAIGRAVRLQSQLVDDLLDLSRIIAGKLAVDLQPLSAVAIIEAAVETFAGPAAAKQVRLTTELDPAAAMVTADPARLQQVLGNLIGNAVKFTPSGGSIAVRLRQAGDRVLITVADDGVGIDPEFLPHIFDRFTQAESSSTRHFGGLGLGLAISSSLAQLMGGTLEGDSPGKGQGSSFTLTLPAVERAARAAEGPTLREESADLARMKGLRVLLVDDDLESLDALNQLVGSCGAIVKTAASAREALTLLPRFHPDLIMSDLAMPEQDGYELIRKIRALPRDEGGRTPAVALTAYAGSEVISRVLGSGFQAHLSKPVDADRLCRVISDFAPAGQSPPPG